MRRLPFLISVLAVLGLVVAFCNDTPRPVAAPAPAASEHSQSLPEELIQEINLAAVGDLLMHLPVVNSTWDGTSQTYDFDRLFTEIQPLLSSFDYTVANLETRLAGPARGYHGYPLFNTPDDLAPAIRRLGVDLLTTANNHSLDMGWAGIVRTLDKLDEAQVPHIGTYRTAAERQAPFLAEVNGIRLGIVNYTATTNGLPLPPDHPYAVALLDESQVSTDLARLRTANPDLIIAIVHWGTEYLREPDASQRHWAKHLATLGVDLIIGQHPHVVQPIEQLESSSVDAEPHHCYVAYSVGNFISNQRWRYSDSGIILHVGITRDARRGSTIISSLTYTPIWVDTYTAAGRRQYRVLAVPQALAAYDTRTDALLTTQDYERLQQVQEEMATLLDQPEWGIGQYPIINPAATNSEDLHCGETGGTSP